MFTANIQANRGGNTREVGAARVSHLRKNHEALAVVVVLLSLTFCLAVTAPNAEGARAATSDLWRCIDVNASDNRPARLHNTGTHPRDAGARTHTRTHEPTQNHTPVCRPQPCARCLGGSGSAHG